MELIIIAALLYIAAVVTYQVIRSQGGMRLRSSRQRPIFVDTSVLIDGRIVAVAESGFLTSPLYIPRSVVGELQLLADGGDSDKRARARHGLDVVKILQGIKKVDVTLFSDSETAREGVDNRLLSLAKKHGGVVCTIDYNLNKVAQVEGLGVLNVNELAKSLRMAYLPGERLMLELTQKGNDAHQAVGHLADGTMVVVEHASQQVGKTLEIEFIRSLQTAAGKMMFAKLTQQPQPKPAAVKPRKAPTKQASGRAPKKETKQPHHPVQEKAQKSAQAKKQTEKPGERKKPQQRRQRKTNEDRMVELANQ